MEHAVAVQGTASLNSESGRRVLLGVLVYVGLDAYVLPLLDHSIVVTELVIRVLSRVALIKVVLIWHVHHSRRVSLVQIRVIVHHFLFKVRRIVEINEPGGLRHVVVLLLIQALVLLGYVEDVARRPVSKHGAVFCWRLVIHHLLCLVKRLGSEQLHDLLVEDVLLKLLLNLFIDSPFTLHQLKPLRLGHLGLVLSTGSGDQIGFVSWLLLILSSIASAILVLSGR